MMFDYFEQKWVDKNALAATHKTMFNHFKDFGRTWRLRPHTQELSEVKTFLFS